MSPGLAPLEGKYEILAKIKEGGMGAIYKVRHRLLDEVRVVKTLRRELEADADQRRRFIHEARSAIRLRHPNVVQIFDFLIESDVGFIVMEYIDGVDFSELIRSRRRLSLPLFLELAGQGLAALGYLHQKGFVHRDVSPDNLMLASDFAGRPLVKIIDLGIAKNVEKGPAITASGMYLGKFRYSSPEHFGSQGTGGIEPRSDLYSYGVVLYELATGSYPVAGDDPSQIIAGHLFHPPRSFEETDPDERVPKALRAMLLRSLDKDPGGRFASADEFAAGLAELRHQFPVTGVAVEEACALRALRAAEEPLSSDSAPAAAPEGDLFDHHLQAACALAEEGSVAESIPHFEAALAVRPDNEAVRRMLDESHRKLAEEQEASRARLADEIRQLRRLLESGEHAQARERLLSARRAYGDVEPLVELRREIDRAKGRERTVRIRGSLSEVVRLREGGLFTEAVRALESARKAWRSAGLDDPAERSELAAELDRQGALLEEAHRQAAALDEAIYEVESALAAGKLVDADRDLFQAFEAFGKVDRLLELRKELDELHHQELGAEIRGLLDEAAQLAAEDEISAARSALEKARIMSPDDSTVGADIEECRRSVDEAAIGWRKQRLERLAGEIERLVESQNLEQAEARLKKAEPELESAADEEKAVLDDLRDRITDGFQERVNALIHEAGVAIEARRYDAAIPFLEQALELSPGDDWLADRLEQARTAATGTGESD